MQLSVLVCITWVEKFERFNNNVFGLKDWLIQIEDQFVNNTNYFHAVHCHSYETNFESNGIWTDGSLVSWPLFRLQPLDNQSFFYWIFDLGTTLHSYYCCLTATLLNLRHYCVELAVLWMVDEIAKLIVAAEWIQSVAEPVIVLTAEQVTDLVRQYKQAEGILPSYNGHHL